MDCYSGGEKRDLHEKPQILNQQRDLLGPLTYAAADEAEAETVDRDQMDLLAVALLPFEQRLGVRHCLIQQTDHELQMDLELVLHKLVAAQLYTHLHHISC